MSITEFDVACLHYLNVEKDERRGRILDDLESGLLQLAVKEQEALYELFRITPPTAADVEARFKKPARHFLMVVDSQTRPALVDLVRFTRQRASRFPRILAFLRRVNVAHGHRLRSWVLGFKRT